MTSKQVPGPRRGTRKAKKKMPMPRTKTDLIQNKRIDALNKKVKQIEGKEELKYFDTIPNPPLTLGVNGSTYCLNDMGIGGDPFDRVGDYIYASYVQIKGYITGNVAATSDRLIRVQLYWDKASTSGAPSMYDSTTQGNIAVNDNRNTATLIPNVFAPVSQEFKDRLTVIHDRVYHYHQYSVGTDSFLPFTITKRLGRKCRFNNPAANSVPITNALYIAFSMDNVPMGISYFLNFRSRFYFKDT